MKGDIPVALYYTFVIVAGIFAVIIATRVISGEIAPETQALETATRIALNINALSSTDSGQATLEFERKIDLELHKKDRVLRTVARTLLPYFIDKYIDKRGWYVVVTPYTKSYSYQTGQYEETKGDSEAVFILSYPEKLDLPPEETVFIGINKTCIIKEPDKEPKIARVVRC